MNAESTAAKTACVSDGIWVKMSPSKAIRRESIFASCDRPREVTKSETDRRSAPARREIIPFWTRRSHSVVVVEGVTPKDRARSAGRWPARDEINASARYCWIDNSPSSTTSEFAAIATKMRLSRRRSSPNWSGRFCCVFVEPLAGGRTGSTVHTVTRTIAFLKLFEYPNSLMIKTMGRRKACRTHLLPRCFVSSRQRGPLNPVGDPNGSARSWSAALIVGLAGLGVGAYTLATMPAKTSGPRGPVGPQGLTGPQGPQGVAGPKGVAGQPGTIANTSIVAATALTSAANPAVGTVLVAKTSCPFGLLLLSGGAEVSAPGVQADRNVGLRSSFPLNKSHWQTVAIVTGPLGPESQ